jgi:cytochrome c5
MNPARARFAILVALAAIAGALQAQTADLRGEQVVKLQCIKCHEAGVNGAPKIGDREAWIPRMKQGMDRLVRSAIRGHGKMPARGGMAQLTDPEFRAAVLYMVNGRAPEPKQAPAPAAAPDPNVKVVGGTEFRLGVVAAESLRGRPEASLHGGIPKGSGYYHINVSLHDSKTKAELKDARVEARVANALSGETKKLEGVAINGMTAYGNYFRLRSKDAYTITIEVYRAGSAQPTEAKFDLKR